MERIQLPQKYSWDGDHLFLSLQSQSISLQRNIPAEIDTCFKKGKQSSLLKAEVINKKKYIYKYFPESICFFQSPASLRQQYMPPLPDTGLSKGKNKVQCMLIYSVSNTALRVLGNNYSMNELSTDQFPSFVLILLLQPCGGQQLNKRWKSG